jgi:hypothetical protein
LGAGRRVLISKARNESWAALIGHDTGCGCRNQKDRCDDFGLQMLSPAKSVNQGLICSNNKQSVSVDGR